MGTKLGYVTIDCADSRSLAPFWAAALGYQVQPPPPGFDSWEAFLDARGVPEDQRNNASAIALPTNNCIPTGSASPMMI